MGNNQKILQTAFGWHENPFPIRNPGQWSELYSGIYQNWYRDFNAQIGRYLEIDPIGLNDGTNQYGYAYQNPVRYFDINGKAVFAPCDGGDSNGSVRCSGVAGEFWIVNCDSHPCTKHCTEAHERSHLSDFMGDMPSACEGARPGGLPLFSNEMSDSDKNEWHARTECRASTIGLRCARESLEVLEKFPQWFRSWCNDTDCRKEILNRMDLEKELLRFYGCVARGFN